MSLPCAIALAGRRVFRLGLAATLMVTCAACSTSRTSAPRPETQQLRVGVVPILSDVAFFIALDSGMFARAGLHVTPVTTAGAEQSVPMMEQGKLDVVFGNWVSILKFQDSGTQLRIVAGASEAAPNNYIIAVKPTSSIRTPADLAGKTIGVNTTHNIATMLTDTALRTYNVDASSVKYREVPFPNMEDALRTGKIDAAFFPEPFLTKAEADMGTREIMDLAKGPTAGLPMDGYVTSAAFAAKNPKTDALFQKVLQETQATMDRQTIGQTLRDSFFNIPPLYSGVVSASNYPVTLNFRRLQRVADVMSEARLLSKSFNLAQMKAPGVQVS